MSLCLIFFHFSPLHLFWVDRSCTSFVKLIPKYFIFLNSTVKGSGVLISFCNYSLLLQEYMTFICWPTMQRLCSIPLLVLIMSLVKSLRLFLHMITAPVSRECSFLFPNCVSHFSLPHCMAGTYSSVMRSDKSGHSCLVSIITEGAQFLITEYVRYR